MKQLSWAIPLSMMMASSALAGEALISGQGQVLSDPDFVTLSINVSSVCYNSPEEARTANDNAARKIVDYLNTTLDSKDFYNRVVATGGYTSGYQSYRNNQVYCKNTYQKNHRITYRTQKVEGFEATFDAIQKKVFAEFESTPKNYIEKQVTSVSMSNPNPGVSHIRRHQLESKALNLALKDAKGKLLAMFEPGQIKNLEIEEISELRPDSPTPFRQYSGAPKAMAMRASADEAAPAPIQFDEQWVRKVMYFRFSFDDVKLTND